MSSLPSNIGKRMFAPYQVYNLPVALSVLHQTYTDCVEQKELMKRLASEKHRDPINLKYRLDSQGKKYGKIIEFR